jgi:hypothetical protein
MTSPPFGNGMGVIEGDFNAVQVVDRIIEICPGPTSKPTEMHHYQRRHSS